MVYMKYSSQLTARQLHSTETALLRVQNDILQAVDSRGGAILVLLDLSAAFDIIDHEKLIRTLDIYCGIKGDPLKWFLPYLKGRVQSVQIGSTFSREQNLLFGVPQGSVLGPVLFTIYTTPLGRIIQRHGLTYHLYADDTQLYKAFKPSDVISKCDAISRIEACVADIRIWMNDNFLKLNDDKTELLIITTREELSKISDIAIKVGDQSISPSDDPPRNLGAIFDSTCCLDAHIAKLCRSINFNLYSVGKIREYLDGPTAEKMINATVTSRLDYCNSLLYGVKQSHIDRLQCCQNNAARIISKRRKFDHISPVLRELHWLPVEHRISYKILHLTYKALNGHAPQYRHSNYAKILPFYTLTDYNVEREFISTKIRFEKLINNEKFECLLKDNKYEQIFSPSNMTPCQYFDEDEFIKKNRKSDECLNIFALNIRSLPKHGGELLCFLKDLNTKFDVTVLTEIGLKTFRLSRNCFQITIFTMYCPKKKNKCGGVGIYTCHSLTSVIVKDDIKLAISCDCVKCEIESLFIEFCYRGTTYIVGGIYRNPNGNVSHFISDLEAVLNQIDND